MTAAGPVFPLRTALLLLISVFAGAGAGVLTFLSNGSVPTALLVGFAAAGTSLVMFNELIGT